MQEPDKEKLRAFEQKMHDEGADGFADGPRPWETWDESGAQAEPGKRAWDGKARRIYRSAPARRSLGERILSGLAVVAMATMVVGIAGVYFTEEQPQTVAWTAVQPTPIPLPDNRETALQRLPARVIRPAPVLAEIETLPSPAAGSTAGTDDASASEEVATDDPPLAAETGDESADTSFALQPSDNETDIEIITAPTALLLRSTGDAYPDSSDVISGIEVDTELAMEIATAPAADSALDDTVAYPDMVMQDMAASTPPAPDDTASSNPEIVTATHTNLINRGSTTAAQTATEDAIPETGTYTTQSSEPASDSLQLVTMTAATLDSLPTTTAGSVTTASNAPGGETGDEAGIQAADTAPTDNDSGAPDMDLATTDSPLAGDSENTVVAMVESQPAPAAPSAPVVAAAPTGDWVVNLASYTYISMARKKLEVFQAKGVNGEIENTTVNGKPLYRIRVTGFESSRAARASIPELEKTLGLDGAWIARR